MNKKTIDINPHLQTICRTITEKHYIKSHKNTRSEHELPPMNIAETSAAFLIQLGMPGYRKECLKMSVDNDVLSITAEEVEPVELRAWKYMKQEIHTEGFTQSFLLPDNVQDENITATYKEGVLTIVLPKSANAVKTKKEISIL